MDPATTRESQLFLYKLSLWLWAACWPAAFAFTLWQMLVADHLAVWEVLLMAGILTGVAQTVFIVGHELVHRRVPWERRLGEFLLASVSYPHYATEHVYIHHPRVCTPGGPGFRTEGRRLLGIPAPGGDEQSAGRLAVRTRSPCAPPAAGLALHERVLAICGRTRDLVRPAPLDGRSGGLAGIPRPLQQRRLLDEGQQLRAALRTPADPDAHGEVRARQAEARLECRLQVYQLALLQHAAPRRPPHLQPALSAASASRRGGLPPAAGQLHSDERPWRSSPSGGSRSCTRWSIGRRAQFYPQIDDWSAYDSRAFAARPDAFDAITEIHGAAPRIASWINHSPQLLDRLRDREFTDLDLPDGFGPDPEFESIARQGLARLYWTHELSVAEMQDQLEDIPVQDAGEAVEAALEWSNGKVFQIAVHTMRGSLSPAEAGTALSRVAEASIATVLAAVEEDFADRGTPPTSGGVAVAMLGSLATGEAMPGVALDVRVVYEGGPDAHYRALCRRFGKALRALSRGNLLLAPIPRAGIPDPQSVAGLRTRLRDPGSAREVLDFARARWVFASGETGTVGRLERVLGEALDSNGVRRTLMSELSESAGNGAEPDLTSLAHMRGGLRDIERAASYLQLDLPELRDRGAASVFRAAGRRGLIRAVVADRLAEAATLWRNLDGSMRLVVEDSDALEAAAPSVKAVIATAGGLEDFGAVTPAIRETASAVAAEIDVLTARQPTGVA